MGTRRLTAVLLPGFYFLRCARARLAPGRDASRTSFCPSPCRSVLGPVRAASRPGLDRLGGFAGPFSWALKRPSSSRSPSARRAARTGSSLLLFFLAFAFPSAPASSSRRPRPRSFASILPMARAWALSDCSAAMRSASSGARPGNAGCEFRPRPASLIASPIAADIFTSSAFSMASAISGCSAMTAFACFANSRSRAARTSPALRSAVLLLHAFTLGARRTRALVLRLLVEVLLARLEVGLVVGEVVALGALGLLQLGLLRLLTLLPLLLLSGRCARRTPAGSLPRSRPGRSCAPC
jgi:hypothetical protein